MEKTIQTIVAINTVQWYSEAKERLATLPLKDQWAVFKNIKTLQPYYTDFENFKAELTQKRAADWFVEDNGKCEKVTDEEGKEVLKVKDEYLEDFYKYY